MVSNFAVPSSGTLAVRMHYTYDPASGDVRCTNFADPTTCFTPYTFTMEQTLNGSSSTSSTNLTVNYEKR